MADMTWVCTSIKEMQYRDNPTEQWSNTYGFSGLAPVDNATFEAYFRALAAEEKTIIPSDCRIVGAYGYDQWPDQGGVAKWGIDLTAAPNTPIPGTFVSQTLVKMAGDQAAWVRWNTGRRSVKGKPIYLRKYYHHGFLTAGGGDGLEGIYETALLALGNALQTGAWGNPSPIADPGGGTIVGHSVSPYVTTRTLKRRGKRPPLPSRGSSSAQDLQASPT